jgi:hypothetical protein
VLVERVAGGVARGTARAFLTVSFPAGEARRGELVPVRVARVEGDGCAGARE